MVEVGFGCCEAFGEVVAEGDLAVVDAFQAAVQVHAPAAEVAEVDVVAAFGAGEQWVAGEAGGGGGECLAGEGVDAVVGAVFGGFEHPVDEVVAAVSAGCFGAGGDGEVDLTTGADVRGELSRHSADGPVSSADSRIVVLDM